MKFYLKQSLFPFIYIIFMAAIALGILMIQDLIWLQVILAVLNVGLYGIVVCAASFKDGQEAMKVQIANDLERREMIRTGMDRPLKLAQEYKPWKGFVFGLIACIPLVLLLAIHTVVHFATGGAYSGIGAIAGLVYMMFFIFFRFGSTSAAAAEGAAESAVIPWYTYYGALIALPVVSLLTGIAYILGAKKIMRQQEMIKERQRQIYGDK